MRRMGIIVLCLLVLALPALAQQAGKPWRARLQYVEACSCDLFCPCYFNDHAEHMACEFNMAARVVQGYYGDVKLDGAKYWISGDLGPDWAKKSMGNWAKVTFDPSVTKEQREGLVAMITKVYYWKWKSLEVAEAPVQILSATGKEARARLGNGEAEMVLERFGGNDGKNPVVIRNLRYFGADSNTGFVPYKSKVHRMKDAKHQFNLSGLNAFTIEFEAASSPNAPKLEATSAKPKAD